MNDSVLDIDDRHGRAWADLRGDRLAKEACLERFCALMPAEASVLDIGCGSVAPIARALIRRGFEVTGVGREPDNACLVPA